MRNLALLLSASLVAALGAGAPVLGEEATNPDWLRMPNVYQMMQVFPREALRQSKSGEARIRCKVSRQGPSSTAKSSRRRLKAWALAQRPLR